MFGRLTARIGRQPSLQRLLGPTPSCQTVTRTAMITVVDVAADTVDIFAAVGLP